ncbi:MAG: hypothetical protein ACP5GY_05435 [Vulcanisaeta sp.]
MSLVIYVEGTVHVMGKDDYWIYVHRKFRKYVQNLKRKKVRIIIIGEIEE